MIDGGTIKYFRDRRFRRGIKSWNEIIERTRDINAGTRILELH